MSRTPNPIIVKQGGVPDYLKGVRWALNLSVDGLAKKLGISRAGTYKILSGEVEPSAKILARVGLEKVYIQSEPVPLTLNLGQFPDYLKMVASVKTDVATLAKDFGVSRSAIYGMLSGDLPPGAKVLGSLGLQVGYEQRPLKGEK
ncbi:helix-turn-helix transcriptional regulator [Acidobacteria bacterium AB60]|nr:helix-turn-helix transcriptional regulator [Acidobacteria bacterium AB60]